MITTFYIPNVPAWAYGCQDKGPNLLVVADGAYALSLSTDLAAAGATVGEKVERLRHRFPALRVVSRNRTTEAIAWERLLERLNRETPQIYAPEIGRCSCQIKSLAVVEQLARNLDLLVGAGPSKRTAELAAFTAWRGIVNLVDFENPDRWITRLSVQILAHYRFTPAMIERLELLGLVTLGAVRRLSKRHLIAQWGSEGERLWRFLRRRPDAGIPLYRPPLQIKSSHRFEVEVLEPYSWVPLLQRIILELTSELDNLTAAWVSVRLDEGGLRSPEEYARLLPVPTSQAQVIERTVASLLMVRPEPIPFCVMTVSLGGIQNVERIQASLFDRRPEIVELISRLARRFPNVLMRVKGIREEEVLYEKRVDIEKL